MKILASLPLWFIAIMLLRMSAEAGIAVALDPGKAFNSEFDRPSIVGGVFLMAVIGSYCAWCAARMVLQ
jgi:hypothetical protein